MPIAKVLREEVNYEPGSFQLVQGVKDYYEDRQEGSARFTNRGSGWGSYSRSSTLAVGIEVEGKNYEIWIDFFFKKYVGQLTQNIRDLIGKTTPEEIEVTQHTGRKGTAYYKPTEAALQAWLLRFWQAGIAQPKKKQRDAIVKRYMERHDTQEASTQATVDHLLVAQGYDLDTLRLDAQLAREEREWAQEDRREQRQWAHYNQRRWR